jgi:hypothetical protein
MLTSHLCCRHWPLCCGALAAAAMQLAPCMHAAAQLLQLPDAASSRWQHPHGCRHQLHVPLCYMHAADPSLTEVASTLNQLLPAGLARRMLAAGALCAHTWQAVSGRRPCTQADSGLLQRPQPAWHSGTCSHFLRHQDRHALLLPAAVLAQCSSGQASSQQLSPACGPARRRGAAHARASAAEQRHMSHSLAAMAAPWQHREHPALGSTLLLALPVLLQVA